MLLYKQVKRDKTNKTKQEEHKMDNIKMTRFRTSYVPFVVLKNNDFILFMSYQTYNTWCIGRTYYDDLYQCYRRSDFKISKELAEKFDMC